MNELNKKLIKKLNKMSLLAEEILSLEGACDEEQSRSVNEIIEEVANIPNAVCNFYDNMTYAMQAYDSIFSGWEALWINSRGFLRKQKNVYYRSSSPDDVSVYYDDSGDAEDELIFLTNDVKVFLLFTVLSCPYTQTDAIKNGIFTVNEYKEFLDIKKSLPDYIRKCENRSFMFTDGPFFTEVAMQLIEEKAEQDKIKDMFSKFLANMDPELFTKQKEWLYKQFCELEPSGSESSDYPEGILNMMDQLQDLAEEYLGRDFPHGSDQ